MRPGSVPAGTGARRPVSGRLVVCLLAFCLLAEAAVFAFYLRYPNLRRTHEALLLTTFATPLWGCAVALLARLRPSGRQALLWVLGAGTVFQLLAIAHRPTTSDDDYRYTWDATVQLSGTDPYRYPPSAPQLAHLRDAALFGPPVHCAWRFPGGCTSINRPTVRTVYPPVAQAAFTVLRVASFGGRGGHLPLQLAGALGSLAIGGLLLRRSPGRPWPAALWTWSPLVVVEYGNNAHIDWLAGLLVVPALALRRSVRLAGALVGAAVAVKLYPLLVLPSLMRRSWQAALAAASVVAVSYLPHVLAVGAGVLGYLPGYLSEEQYGSGGRLAVLGAFIPHPLDTLAGLAIMAAVGWWAWRRGPTDDPARSAVIVVGAAFAVFTPHYPWYAGLLLALVTMTGALEWLPLVIAPTYMYLLHADHWAIVGVAATAVLAGVRHPARLRLVNWARWTDAHGQRQTK